MLWLTGDLHGEIDISKLNTRLFPEQKSLSRSDYVLVCGDFGLVWDGSRTDMYWLDWLEEKPFTTLWIDGNHENFDMLAEFPIDDWHGGKIQRIREHVLHLCRGSLFDLDGIRVFSFGGAQSRDRAYRTSGLSFWEQEMPSEEEMKQGRQTLSDAGWQTDIVVSHTLPGSIQSLRFPKEEYPRNELTDYFDEINSRLNFRCWFTGHYHRTELFMKKYYMLYQELVRYSPDGSFFPAGHGRNEEKQL